MESFQKAITLAPENLDFRRETAAVQWQLGVLSSANKIFSMFWQDIPTTLEQHCCWAW